MNPVQIALARAEAIKNALGGAASKTGDFIGKEVQGTLANLSPDAIKGRWQDTANAANAQADTATKATGFPGGVAQWAQWDKTQPHPVSGNMLGDLAHGIVNAYRKITHK